MGKPQVSNFGRYKNYAGVISKPKPRNDGYIGVRVEKKDCQMHRLIAMAFNLPKREDQSEVDHIDGNPSNNHLTNLRWANVSEQIKNSYATNKNRGRCAGKLSKPVEGKKIGESIWIKYVSVSDAVRKLDLHPGPIVACCRKDRKKSGGYEFRYAEQNEPELLEGEIWKDVVL